MALPLDFRLNEATLCETLDLIFNLGIHDERIAFSKSTSDAL